MTATVTAPVEVTTVTTDLLEKWATDATGPVALHLRQKLLPVTTNDSEGGIIYPPTYANIGYSIDTLSDGKRVALIDSVGSQANRMEPIFKQRFSKDASTEEPVWLVPQIEIVLSAERPNKRDRAGTQTQAKPLGEKRSLLDLAHRSADAVVRSCPTLKKLFDPAFESLRRGDAGPLCALAPTSLVFGVWDSRGGSGERRPRLVRSIIRAWDVDVLHAAAQFNSVWKALDENQRDELMAEAKKANMKELSAAGLKDAPSVLRKTELPIPPVRDGAPNPEARVLGGVLVRDRIEREVTVNLVALRNICGAKEQESKKIQKYLFGLALLAATHEIDLFLREGCHLRYAMTEDDWYAVPRRGTATKVNLGSKTVQASVLEFTLQSAKTFLESGDAAKNGWPPKHSQHQFDIAEAKKLLAKKDQGTPDEE